MSTSAVIAKKIRPLHSPFKATAKLNAMCIESSPTKISNKIPNKLFMKRVNVGNERFLAQIKMRNLVLVDRFSVDFENVDLPMMDLIKPLKRMKYLRTLFVDGPAQKPIQTNKLMPSLYNRTRGISSPLLLREQNEERISTIRMLKKFKLLTNLHINTTGLQEEPHTSYTPQEMRRLHSSLLALRNLESLILIENFPKMHEQFIEMMTRQLRSKRKLKKLGFFMLQTVKKKNDVFTNFLKALEQLQTLEDFHLCVDGKDMSNKNIKQFCKSLGNIPTLKYARLMLIQPTITKDFIKFNKIGCLRLDLSLSLSKINFNKMKVLNFLEIPLMIRLDETDDRRMKDILFMGNLFKILVKVPKLTQFSYYENLEHNVSIPAKQNFAVNFSLLSLKNFHNLKKLHLTFNDSMLLELMLGFLTPTLKKMTNLEHIDINIFEYFAVNGVDRSILYFLKVLSEVSNLKELFFSIDGELSTEFSSEIINSLTKCTQLRTLGAFSLRTTITLLFQFFSKISRMKNLESLLVWFSPMNDNFDESYTPHIARLFPTITSNLKELKNLESLNLRFPTPNLTTEDLCLLRSRIEGINSKTNVKLGGIPMEFEGLF